MPLRFLLSLDALPTMATATATTQTGSPTKVVRNTKVPTRVFSSSDEAARHVALMVEGLIREKASAGLPVLLGLPTGSTPVGVYRELIRLHREENLDFSNCITFNLDEYYPMQPDELQSYHRWMQENFFDHVNIPPEQIHLPDGTVPAQQAAQHCTDYEASIQRAGGFDMVILGIGRTGHVGFNEPGSARNSRTRMVTLDAVTRRDAASDFFGEEHVPQHALTMGVGTILSARKVVMIALGEHKAPIVQKALEGPVTDSIAASFLQEHPDAVFIVDAAASAELTAVKMPWLLGPVRWTPELIRRAVLWLSFETERSLLKLSDEDFREHELHDLLREHGPAETLCQRVFEEMSGTLCAHPAGTEKKTVLCFSPPARSARRPAPRRSSASAPIRTTT
jgi:glucosamine-6-phosphate deaminase